MNKRNAKSLAFVVTFCIAAALRWACRKKDGGSGSDDDSGEQAPGPAPSLVEERTNWALKAAKAYFSLVQKQQILAEAEQTSVAAVS